MMGYGAIWNGGSPGGDAGLRVLRLAAERSAGAHPCHVAVQVLEPDPLPALRGLAGALGVASS
jgi:hypothetical protein